ncbi:related to DNA mismatch repair protein MLH3 [Zygosaccharomyces bailii ISA1307]|nr:related to DNA mismatch repair protein MLH3 [Zygosaccharomyces bailii ISA1307]
MAKGVSRLNANVSTALRSQILTVTLSSAIREVVQNSVDAGASRVKVVFDPTKLSFVVTDNGRGIDAQDLDQVGRQYFTSKIRSLDDLTRLNTFGFRGEALFCISNLSHVTVVTKRLGSNQCWIRKFPFNCCLYKGQQEVQLDFLPKEKSGTITLVRDVFHNIPVRRKLLNQEPFFKTIFDIKKNLFQILIKHPETKLEVAYLDPDGKHKQLIISSDIKPEMDYFLKLSQCFSNVFGPVIPIDMFSRVSVGYKNCSVIGLISKCSIHFKEYQYIYLNGRRYVDHSFKKSIDGVFQKADFGTVIHSTNSMRNIGKTSSNHPLIILDVQCPNVAEDLMQDPAKDILSSSQAQILHPLIIRAVSSFLVHQGHMGNHFMTDEIACNTPRTISPEKNVLLSPETPQSGLRFNKQTSETKRPGKSCLSKKRPSRCSRKEYEVAKPVNNKLREGKQGTLARLVLRVEQGKPNHCNMMSLSNWNNLGRSEVIRSVECKLDRCHLAEAEVIKQLDKKFILLKVPPAGALTNPLLIILDQHACDERIKLESSLNDFLHQVFDGTLITQPVSSCAIDVDVTDGYLFKHYKDEFEKWGIFYDIRMSIVGCLLVVSSLPGVLKVKANCDKIFLKDVLFQMVHDLKNSKKLPISKLCAKHHCDSPKAFEWWKYVHYLPVTFQDILNNRACRSAIMFGDTLSIPECTSLVKKLAICRMPFLCAHGRPSAIPLLELTTAAAQYNMTSENAKNPYLDYKVDI